MSFAFNALHGLIIVRTEVEGPSGRAIFRLALDTGATTTLISVAPLVALGYDPALAPSRVQVTTGSGIEFVPRILVTRITALSTDRISFPVLCHTLPSRAGIDGLLGLDFLRGQVLTIDFRAGQVTLT
jgi:hypothetical protein